MALQLNRFTSSVMNGIRAFWTTYRQEDYVAEQEYNWDAYEVRQARYWHNRRYADNTIYTAINTALNQFKAKEKLYQHIQGLRNPVSRLVRIEKAKVFGGLINFETFVDGAIGITNAPSGLLEAIRLIWQWSNMDTVKGLLVASGSTMGDVALKAVDDIPRKKVRLEVLDPRKVKAVRFDSVGNVKEIELCYYRVDEDTGKEFEFGEFIDKDQFVFFRDHEEMRSYKNPYGYVPVRWIKHVDVSRDFGATSYHETRSKIDAHNDLVTMLFTNMRQQAITKYALVGESSLPKATGSSPVTINVTADERDKAPILPIGKAELKPIVYNADLANGLVLAYQQQVEIEADLPQLTLSRIGEDAKQMSGVAIETVYGDAIDIIEDLQANYMAGLKAGTQMAVSMAAYRGYDGFRGYSIDSYDAGALDFKMKPKPVFRSQIGKEKKLELILQAADSPAAPLVLRQLDVDEKDIQELANAKKDEQATAIRAMFEGTFGGNANNGEMDAREKRLSDAETMPAMHDEMEAAEEYA